VITPAEEDFIKNHAYVPEHIPGYGMAISQGDAFLLEDYLCFGGQGFLIFVGYPFRGPFDQSRMKEILQGAVTQFKPAQLALMAPAIPSGFGRPSHLDAYYKLDLANLKIPPKVRNMIQRAARELTVEKGREFKDEHRGLIEDFLAWHCVDEGTRHIFARIPAYLSSVPSAYLLNATNSEGKLSAFDVAEFGAKDYAFYMFNFRSRRHSVPGASDLLLHSLITEARGEGKSSINLGLGINPQVSFFKKKWGGVPFLSHQFLLYRSSPLSLIDSLRHRL